MYKAVYILKMEVMTREKREPAFDDQDAATSGILIHSNQN
jgi:hypothetical protein